MRGLARHGVVHLPKDPGLFWCARIPIPIVLPPSISEVLYVRFGLGDGFPWGS